MGIGLRMGFVIGLVLILVLGAAPTLAHRHDGLCMPAGQDILDASPHWAGAKFMRSQSCTAEMLDADNPFHIPGDDDDWFFTTTFPSINFSNPDLDIHPFAQISVLTCYAPERDAVFDGMPPLDADLEVWWVPALGPLQPNVQGGLLNEPLDNVPPGLFIGESQVRGQGCDRVSGGPPGGFSGASRWYIHLHRVEGSGPLDVVVTFS